MGPKDSLVRRRRPRGTTSHGGTMSLRRRGLRSLVSRGGGGVSFQPLLGKASCLLGEKTDVVEPGVPGPELCTPCFGLEDPSHLSDAELLFHLRFCSSFLSPAATTHTPFPAPKLKGHRGFFFSFFSFLFCLCLVICKMGRHSRRFSSVVSFLVSIVPV